MKTTGNRDFDLALKRLHVRLAQLARTTAEDPAGRRRKRHGALSTLRSVRAAMDRLFPAIIIKRKFVRLKTFEGRKARLLKAGWRQLFYDQQIKGFALAGVPLREVKHQDPGPTGRHHHAWFAPAWALAIGHENMQALRKAKNSRAEQHAALATAAMTFVQRKRYTGARIRVIQVHRKESSEAA